MNAKEYLLDQLKDYDHKEYIEGSVDGMAAFMEAYHQYKLASYGVLASVSDLLMVKRHLYSLLLQKDGGESESNLTEIEIEIMYQLSLDHQIQEYLINNR